MFSRAAHVSTHDGKYVVVQGNVNYYVQPSPNPDLPSLLDLPDLSSSRSVNTVDLSDDKSSGQQTEGTGAPDSEDSATTVESQTTEREDTLNSVVTSLEDISPVSADADPPGPDPEEKSSVNLNVPKSKNPFASHWLRSRTRIMGEPKSEDKIIRAGNGRVTDIVIPIMGPTGIGKSTFINTLLGTSAMTVGHESSPCTSTLQHAFISNIPNHPSLIGRRIVLVDTPGFDHNSATRVSSWLASSYNTDMRLSGIIYLHDISESPNKMLGTTHRVFETLHKLCRDDVETSVIVGTTKWEQVDSKMGQQREEELNAVCRKVSSTGTKVYRFEGSEKSAWRMVDVILARFTQTDTMDSKGSFSSALLEAMYPQSNPPSFSDSPTLLPGDQTLTITAEDTIVAVMGPTGTGKSSFINTLMRSAVAVTGDDLSSCTPVVNAFGCLHPDGSGRKVVIVDTPGFDDSEGMDILILKEIARWLEQTYRRRITLTGILQFHRIAESRMRRTPLKNLKMFELLCGTDALKNVILMTTFWDEVSEEVGAMRETQLMSEFWDQMIGHGSQVARFQPATYESAWDIIDRFGATPRTSSPRPALQVQTEMVDERKTVEETSAFKFLVQWWERFLKKVKRLGGMLLKGNGFTQQKLNQASEMKWRSDPKRSPTASSGSSKTYGVSMT